MCRAQADVQAIKELMAASPSTAVIIDHWGFFLQQGEVDEESFEALLQLASAPQVCIAPRGPRRQHTAKALPKHRTESPPPPASGAGAVAALVASTVAAAMRHVI